MLSVWFQNNWMPRREKNKPKAIDQIPKEVQQDAGSFWVFFSCTCIYGFFFNATFVIPESLGTPSRGQQP